MKSYTTVAKRYWMAWSVKSKKKRELQVSLPLRRSTYFAFSEIHISPKKEMEVLIHHFQLLRPRYQLEHCITKFTKRKKMNAIFVMHWVKINLGSSLFSFYQGMVRTIKMSFLQKKNIIWDQCHFASSAESLTQTSIFLPRTDCGLIEGKLNTDNIIRSISFNDITNQKKFLF